MTIPRTRLWAGGLLLFPVHMNEDISEILDNLAGRDGPIMPEDGFDVAGSDGYILLPRTDGLGSLSVAEGNLIYDNDTDRLYASDGVEYHVMRTEPITAANIAPLLGTDDMHIAEGDHSHV